MSVIRTENLTYTYSQGTPFEKTAVKDVNIEIEEGELVGIIGHTGSGKSTLIQHLNGLIKPTSGKIFIDGVDIHDKDIKLRDVRFKVGLVFQYPEYQIFEETVYKDIAFGPTNMGLDEGEIDKRVRETAKLVGIDDSLLNKSPFELSGGQKRRVAIAGILAMEPEVIVLDEPTAGLDPKGRDEILDLVAELHRVRKITVVLVSHSMEDVAKYVDRLIVMDDGKVRFDGTPREVFSHYKELEKLGLAAPQVTYVTHALKEKGWDIDTDATTVEEAKNAILKALKRPLKSMVSEKTDPGKGAAL